MGLRCDSWQLRGPQVDPSQLKAMSPGKLVRYTVADGGEVAADQPYAEVEVMKMFMPLLAPAAGAPPLRQQHRPSTVPTASVQRLNAHRSANEHLQTASSI